MKRIVDLHVNYLANPLGVVASPVFSWRNEGFLQTSYRIVVSCFLGVLYDSHDVASGEHSCIEYAGKVLPSLCKCYVSVVCNGQIASESWFVTGCPELATKACWIGFEGVHRFHQDTLWVTGALDNSIRDSHKGWADGVYLEKGFALSGQIACAYLSICGLGFFHLELNGKRVGDHLLQPAQTDYCKRALYSTFDVSNFLSRGNNTCTVILGNGRQVEAYGYEPDPRMIMLLEVSYTDGKKQVVVSDGSWKASGGPILRNSIYEGEWYDAQKEVIDWDHAVPATILEGYSLEPEMLPPIRKTDLQDPVSITSDCQGNYIVDFGQNSSGYVELDLVDAPKGTEIHLSFSELVKPDGGLLTATSRNAHTEDVYICKGNCKETFVPSFTYHGFRYACVNGYPGILDARNIRKVVLHTDLVQDGSFFTDDEFLMRIHKNINWSQRSNVMGIPTDCPQREERMGWLGDVQLASRQAVLNFDMAAFYRKFLDDILYSQLEDGELSDVTPVYWSLYPADPAWGSAYATLLWTLYEAYGDVQSLWRHYGGVKKYIDYLYGQTTDGILKGLGKYGDWCPPTSTFPKRTPIELTSTWFLLLDTRTFVKIASVLNKEEDGRIYQKRYVELVSSFNAHFNDKGKYLANWMSPIDRECSMTSQILPLYLGIVPQEDEKEAISLLVDAVTRRFDYHIDCGIVGLRFLYDVLLRYGYDEVAYKVMANRTYPSLGYMVSCGATTLWERWEYLAGKGMNSHNHIMYGSPDAYFYEGLCGLRRNGNACVVKPYFPDGLREAKAETKGKEGLYGVCWSRNEGGKVDVSITLPLGIKGEFIPPVGWKVMGDVNFDGEQEQYRVQCLLDT